MINNTNLQIYDNLTYGPIFYHFLVLSIRFSHLSPLFFREDGSPVLQLELEECNRRSLQSLVYLSSNSLSYPKHLPHIKNRK